MSIRRLAGRVLFVSLLVGLRQAPAGEPFAFEVTFPAKVRAEPFTGRVILFLSDKDAGEPRTEFSWASRQPIFGQDVRDWRPDTPLRITNPQGFPFALAALPPKTYRVQAVMHANRDVPHSGTAPGNLYSRPVAAEVKPAAGGTVRLTIEREVKRRKPFRPFARSKLVELRSRCLSEFHGRDVFLRAAVVLPPAYEDEPDRRFPALYVIPGFGGDHIQTAMYAMTLGEPEAPIVRIGIDATCPLGHHVFADSASNGPCGRALVEELIPHLEKRFRLVGEPAARLLTGHSSGGWSSLWLQISYPDYFGGTWSTSPDPVDFHDFCGIDLYDRAANFYTDVSGQPRPIMKEDGKVKLLVRDFVQQEEAVGPGGQMYSFEAVFSPRGPDGRPKLLFDRRTGQIDHEVVQAWRRFDIVDRLRREWSTLGPKLAGRITVIMGGEDNFYLAGAARLLKEALAELGSDARVIIVPGKDHGTIMTTAPFRQMIHEIVGRFERQASAAEPAAGAPGVASQPADGG
jgi:hypothetical protein